MVNFGIQIFSQLLQAVQHVGGHFTVCCSLLIFLYLNNNLTSFRVTEQLGKDTVYYTPPSPTVSGSGVQASAD